MGRTKHMPHVLVTNIILSALAAFGIFSTSIYLPSLPTLVKEFNTDQASVQLTLTVFFLGASLGGLLLGPLADYFGRLKIAYWGITIFILATIATTFTSSITMFLVWRFIQGVASSTGPMLSRAISRDLFSGENLTRIMSRIMMVISVSPAIAPVIGGYLQVTFGWEYAFYFLSLAAGIVLLLICLFLPETNKNLAQSEIHPFKIVVSYITLFKDRRFLCYSLILSGIFAALFIFITMSPFIFQKEFGWAPEEYAWVSAMVTVGNVAGFAAANRLTGLYAPQKLIQAGLYLGMGSIVFLISVDLLGYMSDIMVLIYVVFFLGFTAISIANCASSALNLHPRAAGVAAALIGSIQIGSGALGSAIAGMVDDTPMSLGLTMGGVVVFALCVSMAICRSQKS